MFFFLYVQSPDQYFQKILSLFSIFITMKLKSIVIDGFKSYAHRQELADLDPHFNAITGLNGSGKSNIFDALCFVMGISSMKKVRVDDPRELIYKSGNAGIQRASVTIEFSNEDPLTAPDGYPVYEYPVITISRHLQTGGRQKFFFNGKMSELSRIKQFFHGVSLNVDNPHFLVLQGSVHKLVGMKSSEILGWLEEAAGTRVFDARRRVAENLILSKERKLEQINHIMDTEIGPTLQRMAGERDEYAAFVAATENLDFLRKFRVAFTYWQARNRVVEADDNLQRCRDDISAANSTLRGLGPAKRANAESVAALQDALRGPTDALESHRSQSKLLKSKLGELRSRLAPMEKELHRCEANLATLETERTQHQANLDELRTSTAASTESHAALVEQHEVEKSNLAKLKESLQLLSSGVEVGVSGKSLQQELEEADRAEIRINGDIQRRRHKLQVLPAQITQLRSECDKEAKSNFALQLELKRHESALAEQEAAYAPHAAAVDAFQRLRDSVTEKRVQLRALQSSPATVSSPAPRLQYDPVEGVDLAAAIRGRLGEVVTVKNPDRDSKALTVGAGVTNLMKVIVTDDRAVSILIERARLRQRTAFFLLNKVPPGGAIDHMRLAEASNVARQWPGGWVSLALDLIQVAPEFQSVAEKVFGQFVVCSDLDLAKAIAFHPVARCRAVSVDGDVVDPSGTLTGGATTQVRNWLREFAEARRANEPVTALERELRDLEQQAQGLARQCQVAQTARQALEQQRNRCLDMQRRCANLPGADAARQISELEVEVEQLKRSLAELDMQLKATQATRVELQERVRKHDVLAVGKELQAKIKSSAQRERDLKERVRQSTVQNDTVDARISESEAKVTDVTAAVKEKRAEVDDRRAEHAALSQECSAVGAQFDVESAALKAAEQAIEQLELHLNSAHADAKQLTLQEEHCHRTAKEREAEARHLEKQRIDSQKIARDLERSHEYLLELADSGALGSASGNYYFEDTQRTLAALEELTRTEAASEAMSRKVNRKAAVIYDQCKREFDDLVSQRETLMSDRVMILATIQQVEERKWGALDAMVDKVSRGFSALFAPCLPHATARLVEERDGATNRLTGLQVKVAFSGQEKESLTELSGGQRSLLALCLILAILRFRPAPFYVLDEVDAALDPSHTQAIGKMLKAHFADAQFLLVSLKDGMYSSANVVYEVRNHQGYSEVSRRTTTTR